VKPTPQCRHRHLGINDAAALEFALIGAILREKHAQGGLIAHALGFQVGGGVAAAGMLSAWITSAPVR
jgi:hypothetical protein